MNRLDKLLTIAGLALYLAVGGLLGLILAYAGLAR